MEMLLPFASEGMQGIPDALEMLHRAAAGGFVALTDKMVALNGTSYNSLASSRLTLPPFRREGG